MKTTTQDLVEMVQQSLPGDTNAQLATVLSFIDEKAVLEELKVKAMVVKAGLQEPSKTDELAYVVLGIKYPELFSASETL